MQACVSFSTIGSFRAMVFVLLLSFAAQNAVAGGVAFLGPTPYRSAADSPFAEHLGSPNFYLEDFEDGELNTPGIFQPLHPDTHGVVVDLDRERLLESRFYAFRPTDPPISTSFLRFAFDDSEIGQLPRLFGFVWIDGPENSVVSVRMFDDSHMLIDDIRCNIPGDSASDFLPTFLGASYKTGIAFAEITATYTGLPASFQIDDVQYGSLTVPEPQALTQTAVLFLLFGSQRFSFKTVGVIHFADS